MLMVIECISFNVCNLHTFYIFNHIIYSMSFEVFIFRSISLWVSPTECICKQHWRFSTSEK